ncbi:DoxX family membrane protein [Spirosoma sp. HMF4905]|uniref:DoxX family membrane protein n=1 Tax=Spirosoma arboris TaxID=2682092 RepID=A0A7K1SIV6_9BACT|nr:DoxX family protein [Spirosoma arboris]MVM33664.1 DoxX family membrane protein [Spirosoma arboris]
MNNLIAWVLDRSAKGVSATLLLRLMSGSIFLWEGILKFVYTNQGVGRFTKLGFPYPAETAHFIAVLEIVGGILLILGYRSRLVSLIFVGEMIVAILTTKIALYLGTSPLPLPPSPPQAGIWAFLHEVRTDFSLLITCLFIALNGAGPFSVDARSPKEESYKIEVPV